MTTSKPQDPDPQNLGLSLKEGENALMRSQVFLDSMLENLPNMVFVKDAKDLRFVRFNRAGEELIGVPRSDLIGKNDYDIFPKEQADFFTAKDRAVLSGYSILDIPEEFIQTKDKGSRILHTRKIPIFGPDGKPEYLLGISEDITDWKNSENERLHIIREQVTLEERELVARRTAFLAEASTLLASSLDYRQTLKELAELSVPAVADWCTVTIAKEGKEKELVAGVHRDPAKNSLIEKLAIYYAAGKISNSKVDEVLKTGRPIFVHKVNKEEIKAAIVDREHLQVVLELGCYSYVIIPIELRNKILGAISFISSSGERLFNNEDLAIAVELGRRAAIAIENAFLYEAAQAAIRARDEFISIASHELKTPITSLKLQLQMARRNTKPTEGLAPTPEKLAKLLDVSTMQVDRLTSLIDDLLDVTRIQAGKLSLSFEMFDVSALVKDVVESYSEHLASAACTFSVKTEGTFIIRADRYRLEQAIVNLLSNAAKYGAGKPVEFSVSCEDKKVKIICRDYGIGIPPAKLDKIFERFERAVTSKNVSGLGLGLYITRQIIEAHGGSVRVESVLGEGATFSVELPILQDGR